MIRRRVKLRGPAHVCRVPVFAATRRLFAGVVQHRVTTSWGAATITGRLDQRHRDVIDAAMSVAISRREESTGDVTYAVDSARLRSVLGWDRWKYDHIRECLRDLRAAEIELKVSAASVPIRAEWSGILTRVTEAPIRPPQRLGSRSRWRGTPPEPDPLTERPRGGMIWAITVSRAWIAVMEALPMTYPPSVVRLRYGATQAAARMMLSHRDGAAMGWDAVMEALDIRPADRARARRQIVAETDALAELGVVVTDGGLEHGDARPAPEKRGQPRSP